MKSLKKYNLCEEKIDCNNCNKIEDCEKWYKFVDLHKKTKVYAHFDKRVSLNLETIRRYVMDSKKVASHSFYPFIHFTKNISRMKKGEKLPTKKRELFYCCHLDRCVYQRYAFLLNQMYNAKASELDINDVAIAYRDNLSKNNIDFAKEAFNTINEMGECLIIVGDFTSFFDTLDHIYLKKMLCNLLGVPKLPNDYYAVYKNITKYSSFDWKHVVEASGNKITEIGIRTKLNKKETLITKQQFFDNKKYIYKDKKREKGIPQGSPISAVLSNVYMMEFDIEINNYVRDNGGRYMRYSDDFLIMLPYCSDVIESQKEWILNKAKSIEGIRLQKDKTHIYSYDGEKMIDHDSNKVSSLDYLGFIFDGKDIKIRPKSITKYYYRMNKKARTIGRSNWISPTGKKINPKKLYQIYSSSTKKNSSSTKENSQTFIDYAKKSKKTLNLKDHDLDCLIKNHKHKIHMSIKKSQKSNKNALEKNSCIIER